MNLDDNGLAVSSISAKTAFDEDVKHFDRICCHLKTDRFIQICVADKGHLLAVDSEDLDRIMYSWVIHWQLRSDQSGFVASAFV